MFQIMLKDIQNHLPQSRGEDDSRIVSKSNGNDSDTNDNSRMVNDSNANDSNTVKQQYFIPL